MANTWILLITGSLFCLAGIFLFQKNVYEEDRTLKVPIMLLLMGVTMLVLATAKYYHLA
jgi:hypothetical protein